jgi:hypothetical protein
MLSLLSENPNPQRPVFLALEWHETIALLSSALDQLLMLLVPFAFRSLKAPNKAKFVQQILFVWQNAIISMILSLLPNPIS